MLKQKGKFPVGGPLCGLALLLSLLYGWQQLRPGSTDQGLTVVVQQQDREQRLPLKQDTIVELASGHGHNRLVIRQQAVWVEEADCRDQICVKTGKIIRPGEVIACLPHQLLIYIEGKGNF